MKKYLFLSLMTIAGACSSSDNRDETKKKRKKPVIVILNYFPVNSVLIKMKSQLVIQAGKKQEITHHIVRSVMTIIKYTEDLHLPLRTQVD